MKEVFTEGGYRHQCSRVSRFKGYIDQRSLSSGIEKDQSLKVMEHMLDVLNHKVLPVMADLSSLHALKFVWGGQLHQFKLGISDIRSSDDVVAENL